MSKYAGRLEGVFNFIAVDKFTRDVVLGASVFFLSHYHTDHFHGLRTCDRDERHQVCSIFQQQPEKKLYCSTITKHLFVSDDPLRIPANQIIGLQAGESVIVSGPSKDGGATVYVTVTFIPSGHILGSVMFLFECENERALYTGDFRIYSDDVPKLKQLHHSDGKVKEITHLYIDTTFGSPKYKTFPLRSTAAAILVQFITAWTLKDYVFHINLPYRFAYERLLIDISKDLKCKVAIAASDYNKYYSHIPELDNALFPAYEHCSKDKHKIHAHVGNRRDCTFCSMYKNDQIKIIRPCAQTFNQETLNEWLINERNFDYNVVRIPYSTHCSLDELQAFVKYVKPKEIFTIVAHNSDAFIDVKEHVFSLVKRPENVPLNKRSVNNLDYLFMSSCQHDGSDESCVSLDSPPW